MQEGTRELSDQEYGEFRRNRFRSATYLLRRPWKQEGVVGIKVVKKTKCATNRLVHLLLGRPSTRVAFIGDADGTNGGVASIRDKLCNRASLVFASRLPLSRVSLLFFYATRNSAGGFVRDRAMPRGIGVVSLDVSCHVRDPRRSFICNLPRLGQHHVYGTRRVTGPKYFTAYVRLTILPLTGRLVLGSSLRMGTVAKSAKTKIGPSSASRFD